MKAHLLIFALSFITIHLTAQNTFQKIYETTGSSQAFNVYSTHDGGYIASGGR